MNLKINGNIKSFDDTSMTIEGLVMQLNLLGKRIAIEKNGMIISKSEFQKITLQDVVKALNELTPEVKVPEHIRVPAFDAVRRMIAL